MSPAPALRPHVAVLDGRLPDGSGIDVCPAVRSVDPSIRALILTSYDDEVLFAAIIAGAASPTDRSGNECAGPSPLGLHGG